MSNVLMHVAAVAVDQTNSTPIVILRDEDDRFAIPIWIGLLEASAIQIELQHVSLPRPMTHDLLRIAIEQLGSRVVSVEICELRDETFFARIKLEQNGREVSLDARPSDAIALAIRCDAAIFVDLAVAETAHRPELLDRLNKESSTKTSDTVRARSDGESSDSPDAALKEIVEQLEAGLDPKLKA